MTAGDGFGGRGGGDAIVDVEAGAAGAGDGTGARGDGLPEEYGCLSQELIYCGSSAASYCCPPLTIEQHSALSNAHCACYMAPSQTTCRADLPQGGWFQGYPCCC